MRTGILEKVLTRRYGPPVPTKIHGLDARCWNPDEFNYASALYIGMKWDTRLGTRFASLKDIYGDVLGGYLIKNSLNVAALMPREIYGLWRMDQLQMLPAIDRALEIDSDIDFFMDASNVWYYGHKRGDLYEFDSEFDELDSLGPIEPALEELLDRWEAQ
jgi:hypothetical protein